MGYSGDAFGGRADKTPDVQISAHVSFAQQPWTLHDSDYASNGCYIHALLATPAQDRQACSRNE